MMWLFDLGLYSYYLFFYMAKLMLKSAILFPIKMALSILDESSVMAKTRTALLSPSSARVRMRMRFEVVSAVSADEKKPDNSSRIIRTIN